MSFIIGFKNNLILVVSKKTDSRKKFSARFCRPTISPHKLATRITSSSSFTMPSRRAKSRSRVIQAVQAPPSPRAEENTTTTTTTTITEINYNRYKMKLEAESLIATAAALFAGLALTILDGKTELYNSSSNFTLPDISTMVVQAVVQAVGPSESTTDAEHQQRNLIGLVLYLRMILLGCTSVANLYVLTIATTTYFVGTRILAKSNKSYEELNVRFEKFWRTFATARRLSRNFFVLSPALFMLGVALGLIEHLPFYSFLVFVLFTVSVTWSGTVTARKMIASILPPSTKNSSGAWWDRLRAPI